MTQSVTVPFRILLLLGAMLSLVLGAEAGLVRMGLNLPLPAGHLAAWHGPLMVCSFLGTVISLERAVALRRRWAFAGPTFAAVGGLLLITGLHWSIGAQALLLASIVLTAASALIYLRQRAFFTLTLLLGAACWLAGNMLWLNGFSIYQIIPWWTGFLVITIAGERLELTRMLPTTAYSQALFISVVALFLVGCLFATLTSGSNVTLLAASWVALALWLLRYDIARRTVKQQGLTRFIAYCLLSGYVWLLLGGLIGLWSPQLLPGSSYDAALHSVLVGFVFSMIFGHAAVIFPAVSRIKIPYHPAFYLPLTLLHLSLIARIAGDLLPIPHCRQIGGVGNALAILLFILTVAITALRVRRQQRKQTVLQPGNQ